jgi:glutamate-1-semialdehyde 2,1-aminomutase
MEAAIETRTIGRHGHLDSVEAEQFVMASHALPGGVLGGNALPQDVRFVVSHGSGPRFWDTSGNEYIDYVLGSGAMFLGHAHPAVQRAVAEQAGRGTHFFAYLNQTAVELARRVLPHLRCAERIRFTTSGSESTFHAIRMARGFTGRDKVLKFEGAYHGTHDYAQLSTAPKQSSNFPVPQPDTGGIPRVVQDLMLVSPYNDLDALSALLDAHGHEIAAVIVEPIQRIISPLPGFLHGVRELTAKHGVVMILDEVVTGFRYGIGGAQAYFDVVPDMATYGKIIGGGLPVGAVAGRAEIMDQADPAKKGQPGFVYQNGTLQGNPLGCAAALAVLDVLEQPGVYDRVFAMADRLRAGLQEVADRNAMGLTVFGEGPMWHFLFADRPPVNYADIIRTDLKRQAALEVEMLRQGIFVLPNNRRFISIAHTDDDLAQTFAAFDRACRAVKG